MPTTPWKRILFVVYLLVCTFNVFIVEWKSGFNRANAFILSPPWPGASINVAGIGETLTEITILFAVVYGIANWIAKHFLKADE